MPEPEPFVADPNEILEATKVVSSLGVSGPPKSLGRSMVVLGSTARVKSAGPQRSAAAEARTTARADFIDSYGKDYHPSRDAHCTVSVR